MWEEVLLPSLVWEKFVEYAVVAGVMTDDATPKRDAGKTIKYFTATELTTNNQDPLPAEQPRPCVPDFLLFRFKLTR